MLRHECFGSAAPALPLRSAQLHRRRPLAQFEGRQKEVHRCTDLGGRRQRRLVSFRMGRAELLEVAGGLFLTAGVAAVQ